MTEAPFKEAEQQELNSPALLFEEHNKEWVLRSADVSSLFTQGMVKVRKRTKMMEERKDMVQYMADLIRIRKYVAIPRITDMEEIKSIFDFFYLPNNLLTLAIRDEKYLYGHKKILFVINATGKTLPVEFDEYFKAYFTSSGMYADKHNLTVKSALVAPFTLLIFTLD